MPTPVNMAGGNSPIQQAAVQNMRGGATASTPPTQAPGPQGAPPPGGAPGMMPQQAGNEVASLLAAAFEALIRTGPTPENLAALEGFWRSVVELNPAGPSPQAPLGQAPGNSPLPPQAPPPGGMGGMGGPNPMVPPRQV